MLDNFNDFEKCISNCNVGTQEVLKLQHKHAEITRLTYSKNIARCMQIHLDVTAKGQIKDSEDENKDWPGLVNCIEHNTDKVDRRFFGYYNNLKMKMVNKYTL